MKFITNLFIYKKFIPGSILIFPSNITCSLTMVEFPSIISIINPLKKSLKDGLTKFTALLNLMNKN